MIGKQLKTARLKKGMTQKELADAVGVSVGAVKRWEQDVGDPNTNILMSITNELGVTTDYLFGRDEIVEYTDDTTKRLVEVADELTDERKVALLEYAEFLKKHMR